MCFKVLKMRIEITQSGNCNNLIISSVDITLTFDCLLSNFSFDHKGVFSFNERAKYGASFGCDEKIDLASDKKDLYSISGTTLTFLNNLFIKNLNSDELSFEYFNSFSSLLFISSYTNCGEYRVMPISGNKKTNLKLSNCLINEANMIFASITKELNIYNTPCLLATANFTSLASSLAWRSVNLLLDKILLANENSRSETNLFTTFFKASLNSTSNLSGTSTLTITSAIFISPPNENMLELVGGVDSTLKALNSVPVRPHSTLHWISRSGHSGVILDYALYKLFA